MCPDYNLFFVFFVCAEMIVLARHAYVCYTRLYCVRYFPLGCTFRYQGRHTLLTCVIILIFTHLRTARWVLDSNGTVSAAPGVYVYKPKGVVGVVVSVYKKVRHTRKNTYTPVRRDNLVIFNGVYFAFSVICAVCHTGSSRSTQSTSSELASSLSYFFFILAYYDRSD